MPSTSRAADTPVLRDTLSDTWALPSEVEHEQLHLHRSDRFVGVFYFLWLEDRPGTRILDISKLLTENPASPAWGKPGEFHWWGRPYLGYYPSNDEGVIRRHAQMLSDAGVDVVFFDVTNGPTYDEALLTLCRVYEQMRAEGNRTPQISFLTNSGSARVVTHLYETLFKPRLHEALWFRWQDKPLILAKQEGLSDEVKAFFTFRQSWAWTDRKGWFGDGRDKWPWLDHTPQKPGWHQAPDKPEQVAVAVAEHPISNIGRSFHDGKQPVTPEPEKGLYFAEQWRRALEVDPQLIFVTGWNEWIAQRFVKRAGDRGAATMLGKPLKEGETFFVDTFSQEFSRDIEPMSGGHGDAYYYQLAANVRRFKGVRALPAASAPKRIDFGGSLDQWTDVGPMYLDDLHDTTPRDHGAYGGGRNVNATGRNDFDTMKVARDAEHVCFYVKTRETITPAPAPASRETAWMTLLLDTDRNPSTGWHGYEIAVNRRRDEQEWAVVERYADAHQWERIAVAPLRVGGNVLQLAVPRSALNDGGGRLSFHFKWLDNVAIPSDPLTWIDTGDVAPNGRFAYHFPG
jgi:hypothetical protein